MKVIKSGNGQKEWSTRAKCTGQGNDGGGCGAILQVGKSDLFITTNNCRDEVDYYVTFRCVECQVLTDLSDKWPTNWTSLPSHSTWQKRNPAKKSKNA